MGHSTIEWQGEKHAEQVELSGMAAMPEPKAKRGSILDEAKTIINGERQDQYGNPEDNFADIGHLWTWWMSKRQGVLSGVCDRHDVAMMQALLKIARIRSGSGKRDSYVDCAGYVALAADMMEQK